MKKNIKVIGYGLWVMVALLLSAPTLAQSFVQQDPNQVQFQSTSTMTGSGSTYAPTPGINTDGTAYNPAAAPTPSGPLRTGAFLPPPPSVDENDSGNAPVGDAVVPLMVMAILFSGIIYMRRRKALNR